MKRICLYVFAVLLAVSCGNRASGSVGKLDSFVDKVVAEGESYYAEDWEKVNEKFEMLVDSVYDNYDSMSDEERADAMKAIGRYTGIYTKMGVKAAVNGFQKAMEAINPFLDGFSDAFDSEE